jgi:hypothetical protein
MDIKWPDACPLFFVEFFFFISAFHIWIPSLLFFFPSRNLLELAEFSWLRISKINVSFNYFESTNYLT